MSLLHRNMFSLTYLSTTHRHCEQLIKYLFSVGFLGKIISQKLPKFTTSVLILNIIWQTTCNQGVTSVSAMKIFQ